MDAPPGYRTQSLDTDYATERALVEAWRAMDPAEKIELFRQLWHGMRQLSLAGLRLRYPDADDDELRLREAAQRVGYDVVERLTGRRLSVDP